MKDKGDIYSSALRTSPALASVLARSGITSSDDDAEIKRGPLPLREMQFFELSEEDQARVVRQMMSTIEYEILAPESEFNSDGWSVFDNMKLAADPQNAADVQSWGCPDDVERIRRPAGGWQIVAMQVITIVIAAFLGLSDYRHVLTSTFSNMVVKAYVASASMCHVRLNGDASSMILAQVLDSRAMKDALKQVALEYRDKIKSSY